MAPTYDIVAMEMPTVYNRAGDHDPDGLLFAPKAHVPLLTWARDRFEDEDSYLPQQVAKVELVQLVVDGLPRFRQMLERLAWLRDGHGSDEDTRFAADLLDELDDVGARLVEAEGEVATGNGLDPAHRSMRQHAVETFATLVAALDQLTDGKVRRVPPVDQLGEYDVWLARWTAELALARAGVDGWFARLEADPSRSLDGQLATLAAESGLAPARIRRLLLNDHVDADQVLTAPGLPPASAGYDRFHPLRPIPAVEPLVLRARAGEPITVRVRNEIRGRRVGFHVQGGGLGGGTGASSGVGVEHGDGSRVGRNRDTTIGYGRQYTFRYDCTHEGVWPINDVADVRGNEQGSNAHGLFGVLVVEPPGSTWHDPETGEDLSFAGFGPSQNLDVHVPDEQPGTAEHLAFTDFHLDDVPRSFREFTVFIHDEPSVHSLQHVVGGHAVMPLSYRAEPMPNRLPHRMRRLVERTLDRYGPHGHPDPADGIDYSAMRRELHPTTFDEVFRTALTPDGEWLEHVAGEEQHHSSWLFGDPVTPVFRAYAGDPARVRLVHAGVKETHVFHLHVHQWRAVANDTAPPSAHGDAVRGSQILDSITIGPQTGTTIDPLYGSGSRQHATGDIIWHCHLYPHFHHGMWGIWRSFDRLLAHDTVYPDDTPCHALQPLPGRDPAPADEDHPGFPWFMDATHPRKAPPPPALAPEHVGGRRRLLRMPDISALEQAACPPGAVARRQPGAVFVDLDGDALAWNAAAGLAPPRIVTYDIVVEETHARYNRRDWHDPLAHTYRIEAVTTRQLDEHGVAGPPVVHDAAHLAHAPDRPAPFFPRANHGDIVEIRHHSRMRHLPPDAFDLAQLPVEVGLHVHLVKFDPLAADGSCTGWNYLSGASAPETVASVTGDGGVPGRIPVDVSLHRWVVDEEFGPCFFHDHLLANYRQKHGLFGALVAEPAASQWFRPDQERIAWAGPEAVVVPGEGSPVPPFREHCLAVGDFVPLLDAGGRALNPPTVLSADDDPGSMAVNYRSAPLTFQGGDPSQWFSSGAASRAEEDRRAELAATGEADVEPVVEPTVEPGSLDPDGSDPDTPLWEGYPGERTMVRLIQGSHEEQHSLTVNGMRWHRDWHNPHSPLADQQTVGISEAFTLDVDPAAGGDYGPGDHLWQLAAMDDTWLGCWGIWRIHHTPQDHLPPLPAAPPGSSAEQAQHLARASGLPPRPAQPDRDVVVVARRVEHRYDGHHLTDPWGLSFAVATGWAPVLDDDSTGTSVPVGSGVRPPEGPIRGTGVADGDEPLVLRARRGEWVRVLLVNELYRPEEERDATEQPFGVEPDAPSLPLESRDDHGRPDERRVSPRVSLHPSLLRYNVTLDDGSYVGRNQDGTVPPIGRFRPGGEHGGHIDLAGGIVERDGHGHHDRRNWREYWWYADPDLAPASAADGPGQVCYLQDLGDLRNHRHHGLFGALVVEPGDVTPVDPRTGQEAWSGVSARIVHRDSEEAVASEHVLFVHDGVRLFVAGNPAQPVPDMEVGGDAEDAGHKGFSYRCAPVHPRVTFRDRRPSTPILGSDVEAPTWLRVVCAADKPRQHTFTVHGVDVASAPWVPGSPRTGALSGVATGYVADLVLQPQAPGDHCYRSGAFNWAVEQGAWGILRVE